jgi:ethanolamine transporter
MKGKINMNNAILYVMSIFSLIAAFDKVIGNKFGLGEKFDEGFKAMGPLALTMLGILSLVPILTQVLEPIVVPIYSLLGADPSMFAGTLLASDMGGYNLAINIANNKEAALLSGLILSTMMGTTMVFTIPIAVGIIDKDDYKYLAKGILIGITTIPIGCIIGGITAGFNIVMIVKNMLPVIIFTIFITYGLVKVPEFMIKGFRIFGKFIVAVSTITLALTVFQTLTDTVLIKGLAPVWDGIKTVGNIALFLSGAYPMFHFITKVLKNPLEKMGEFLNINTISAAGILVSMANNIPMFNMMKDMDERGKIINSAFAVSGAFVFGGQLAFTAGVSKVMMIPMIVGKLSAGISAVLIVYAITSRADTVEKDKIVTIEEFV